MTSSPSAALKQAHQNAQKAVQDRHPGRVRLLEPGDVTSDEIAGGLMKGSFEWEDDDGVPQRVQGVSFSAAKSRFPSSFSMEAKGWRMRDEATGTTYRVRQVLDWGESWLVRGSR